MGRARMHRRDRCYRSDRIKPFALFFALTWFSLGAQAQFVVPSGATLSLNGGGLDVAGSALQIGGTVGLGSGMIGGATDITVLAGGALDAGSGVVTLAGNWNNLGTFSAASSHVDFVDGVVDPSTLSGNTTFANLSFVSTTGKTYALAGSSTQTITGQLQILGTASAGIQMASANPSQAAFLDLLAGGTQNIAYVGVSNVHATGQHLAPSLSNDGGSGNATGWFATVLNGLGNLVATPATSFAALLLLGATVLGSAWASFRRGRPLPIRA